jgi:DNA-binding transcriptional LysR family regulator
MELRHLRYFVAVAEERSFTRAAERLWVAQPGLSTQVRRLETELGVQLLERHARGAELTEAGELLLERARTALGAADAVSAMADDVREGVHGMLRLGVSSGPGWSRTPVLLERFASERPRVEVTVMQGPGGALWRDLRNGRLDAMIAPAAYDSPDLRSQVLGQEPFVVLAGSAHRLSGSGPLPWSELDGEDIAVSGHRDDSQYARTVAAALEELAVDARLVPSGTALDGAIARGNAVLVTTSPPALSDGSCARTLQPQRDLTFALFWRDGSVSPTLEAFIIAARQHSDQTERPALRAVA